MYKGITENFKTIIIILLVLYIILGSDLVSGNNKTNKSDYTNKQAEESAYWFNMGYEQGLSEGKYEAKIEYEQKYSEAQFEMKSELEEAERYNSENAFEAGYEIGYSDGYSDCEENNGLTVAGSSKITKKKG
jgi:hypothetical protein